MFLEHQLDTLQQTQLMITLIIFFVNYFTPFINQYYLFEK